MQALDHATQMEVENSEVTVLTAEYLAAIALQTGRPKDKARLLQFVEFKAFRMEHFRDIVERHGLTDQWTKFQQQFLAEDEN